MGDELENTGLPLSRRSLLKALTASGVGVSAPTFDDETTLVGPADAESDPCGEWFIRDYVPSGDGFVTDTAGNDSETTTQPTNSDDWGCVSVHANVKLGAVYRGQVAGAGCLGAWDLYVAWQGYVDNASGCFGDDEVVDPRHEIVVSVEGDDTVDPEMGNSGLEAELWQSELEEIPEVTDEQEAKSQLTQRIEAQDLGDTGPNETAEFIQASLTTFASTGAGLIWTGPYGAAAGTAVGLLAAGWEYMNGSSYNPDAKTFQIDWTNTSILDEGNGELGSDVMFFRYPTVRMWHDGAESRPPGELREFEISADLEAWMSSGLNAGASVSNSLTIRFREDHPTRIVGELHDSDSSSLKYEIQNTEGDVVETAGAPLPDSDEDMQMDFWVSSEEFPLTVHGNGLGDEVLREIQIDDLNGSLESYNTLQQNFDGNGPRVQLPTGNAGDASVPLNGASVTLESQRVILPTGHNKYATSEVGF